MYTFVYVRENGVRLPEQLAITENSSHTLLQALILSTPPPPPLPFVLTEWQLVPLHKVHTLRLEFSFFFLAQFVMLRTVHWFHPLHLSVEDTATNSRISCT